MIKIIECPRDAMQGIKEFIPTDKKIRYLNQLLKVGFDTIDFGSFVSPKAIPQMKDTASVMEGIDLSSNDTALLAIVANIRGAREAASFEKITYLGFPLSISETFQLRNTHKSIASALEELVAIKDVCTRHNKKLVTYISMGFGNPYNDPYDVSMVNGFIDVLRTLGSDVISLADTIGVATPKLITEIVGSALRSYSDMEIGVHLHSSPQSATEKIDAAYRSGCRRFDGALKGYGGCPMAKDDLVGNIATESIIAHLYAAGEQTKIDESALVEAMKLADEIFPKN